MGVSFADELGAGEVIHKGIQPETTSLSDRRQDVVISIFLDGEIEYVS